MRQHGNRSPGRRSRARASRPAPRPRGRGPLRARRGRRRPARRRGRRTERTRTCCCWIWACPGMHGLDVLREVTRRVPATKVLVVSAYNRDEFVVSALRARRGRATCSRAPRPTTCWTAVAEVARGGYYVSPQLAGSLARGRPPEPDAPPDPYETLSRRERQVLPLDGRGPVNHRRRRAPVHQHAHGRNPSRQHHAQARAEIADRRRALRAASRHAVAGRRRRRADGTDA